ncbi:hypothetical protein T439DRAFT_331926 [Meredithblackwellia eburnea MCA 4105]
MSFKTLFRTRSSLTTTTTTSSSSASLSPPPSPLLSIPSLSSSRSSLYSKLSTVGSETVRHPAPVSLESVVTVRGAASQHTCSKEQTKSWASFSSNEKGQERVEEECRSESKSTTATERSRAQREAWEAEKPSFTVVGEELCARLTEKGMSWKDDWVMYSFESSLCDGTPFLSSDPRRKLINHTVLQSKTSRRLFWYSVDRLRKDKGETKRYPGWDQFGAKELQVLTDKLWSIEVAQGRTVKLEEVEKTRNALFSLKNWDLRVFGSEAQRCGVCIVACKDLLSHSFHSIIVKSFNGREKKSYGEWPRNTT